MNMAPICFNPGAGDPLTERRDGILFLHEFKSGGDTLSIFTTRYQTLGIVFIQS